MVLDHLEQGLIDAGYQTKRLAGGAVKYYAGITFIVDEKGHKLASVKHGGANPFPNAEGEGAASPAVAAAIRAMPCDHRPTRIDSCLDQSRPGLFAQLHDLAKRTEDKHGVLLNYAGAALDNDERGTTIYLGSPKSQSFVRIYQKGLQLAEKQGMRPDQVPPEMLNWVRSEAVFRPQKKPAKLYATVVSPADVWGVSPWTHEFAKVALSIDAERVNVSQRRESNHERALRAMSSQYRAHIEQLLKDCQWDYAEAMAVIADLAGLTERDKAA